MKFKCEYNKEGKPIEWIKFTRNPFNRHFIHFMILTSIQNDKILSEEFKDFLKKYKDIAYYDCKCKKINWLNDFHGAKYVIASVEPGEEFKRFNKYGFKIVGFEASPFNRLIMVKSMERINDV